MGVYWIHPDVCPSVRPSVDKVSGTFWKNYWLNWFHTRHLPLWGESPDPYPFSCSLPHFWPSVGHTFGRKWGFRNFLKKLLAQFFSYPAFTLMGLVYWPLYIFVFLVSFSVFWWPNIWPKMGFPELFEKNFWLNSFYTWHLSLWGESLEPYTFSCSWPHFRPSGGQIFGRKCGFRNFLKKLLAQIISYLAFTLMWWNSWPLFIFVFQASFQALWWPNIWPKMGFPQLFKKKLLAQFIFFWRIPTCVAHDCKI